jgi:hypothetical protein
MKARKSLFKRFNYFYQEGCSAKLGLHRHFYALLAVYRQQIAGGLQGVRGRCRTADSNSAADGLLRDVQIPVEIYQRCHHSLYQHY